MVSERRHEGADQKHSSQIDIKVCALCKDGPRCKYSNVKEPGSARSITAPSAIGDKVAHTDSSNSTTVQCIGARISSLRRGNTRTFCQEQYHQPDRDVGGTRRFESGL